MCGIAGFFGFRDNRLIKKISQNLSHRGPDDEGYYFNEEVSLLSRRLAIIDIKGGKQPIFNEDKTLVVVYNGEIYNFLELKKELEKKGHVFTTKTDTEVIIHSFEEWQETAFDKFNGMFAIALYDIKNNRLFLARDHFGIKPLYYAFINNKLIFSSEIKPIILSDLIEKKPNDRIIYRYLAFRVHDDSRETFFQGVYRLLPGEIMVVNRENKEKIKISFKKYTHLEEKLKKIAKSNKKINEIIIKETRKYLFEIVNKRLVSDVPVGSCLSGGIDSSIIVSLINRILIDDKNYFPSIGKIQKTFSAIFPGHSNNEEKYINYLIKKSPQIKSYKVYPQPNEFIQDLEDFIKTQEEPTISTGPYAQYRVFKLAKNYVKVVLDGQGLDEILAGYIPYYFVYFNQLFKEKKYLKLIKELWFSRKIISPFLKELFFKLVGLKKIVLIDKLLRENFFKSFKDEIFNPITNNLKLRLINDIFYNSLPALLRYEDKNSMRFSIEGRVPFLDYNFLLFIFSLSDEAIIKNGINKFIVKKACQDLIPKEILFRKNKIGFTTPEQDWFFFLKDKILEIFSSESFGRRKYFNQKEIILAFIDFLEGKNNETMVFWRLLNLELWLRIFFDKKENNKEEEKQKLKPNLGKKLIINVDGIDYFRFPIKTKIIRKNDNLYKLIPQSVSFLLKENFLKNKNFFLVISEKILAVSQGRSFFIWEIKPSFLAKILSSFVTKTPYGIGLGSPWTMELAIREVGLFKILLASLISFITRPFGIKGLFYKIAGEDIGCIDGPTEYSVYPSNISAKLPPKDADLFSQKIDLILRHKFGKQNFLGVAVIDANDLGQKVLANTTPLSEKLIGNIFSDNPMGQTDEQTPLTIVVFGDKKMI